jgi:hypothetical protein
MNIRLKSSIVLVSLIIFLGPSVFAGIAVRGGMAMSISARNGVILAVDTSSVFWSFQGGISYRFSLTPALSLQPEVNLTIKGSHYYSMVCRTQKTVHFDYLEFPVLLNFKDMRFDVFMGPFLAVLINSTPLDGINDWTFQKVKLRGLDAGLVIGVRYFLQSPWYVEARLELGFIPAVVVLDETDLKSYKNQTLCLSIGFGDGR